RLWNEADGAVAHRRPRLYRRVTPPALACGGFTPRASGAGRTRGTKVSCPGCPAGPEGSVEFPAVPGPGVLMRRPSPPSSEAPAEGPPESMPVGPAMVSRRDLLRLGVRGGAGGLALIGLVDVPAARAATESLKLSEISEFTTSC